MISYSPTGMPWQECGVVDDGMPCDREKYTYSIYTLVKHLMLLLILKRDLSILLFEKWLCQF
jgi:hypothetical protein